MSVELKYKFNILICHFYTFILKSKLVYPVVLKMAR